MVRGKFRWLHPDKRLDPSYYSNISPRFAAFLIFDTNYEDLIWVFRSIIKYISFLKKLFNKGPEFFEDINPCIHITKDSTHLTLPENSYVVIMQNITSEISKTFIAEVLEKGIEMDEIKIGWIDLAFGPHNEIYEQYDFRNTRIKIKKIILGSKESRKKWSVDEPSLKLIDLNLDILQSLKLEKYVNPDKVGKRLFRKRT